MPATRDRALDAAVALVGEGGLRALTHARVDHRAGLPLGSTSNWFRTRRALLEGVVDRIITTERADIGAPLAGPTDADAFLDGYARTIELLTGAHAGRTRARYTLFLERGSEEAVSGPLREGRAALTAWTQEVLTALGAAAPAEAATTFMAVSDGLILHRLAVDPELLVRPVLQRALLACLQT